MNTLSLRLPKRFLQALYGMLCLTLSLAAMNAAQAQAPTLTTLHNYNSYADGANPQAEPVQGSDGTFYGTTVNGGTNNDGTVFALKNGVITTIHSFTGNPDGRVLVNRLLLASDGNLYGTSYNGGASDFGTVFKVKVTIGSPNTYVYSKLFDFDGANGENPYGALMQASDGNLYGTTVNGGTNNYGAIYKITGYSGSSPALSLYYSFTNFQTAQDGANPHAGLIEASDGKLYGTTNSNSPGPGSTTAYGTVYQITLGSSPTLTTTHYFDSTDGANPEYGGLYQASDGNIYGTTYNGGTSNDGTIFEIGTGTSPTFSSLRSFDNSGTPGYHPYCRLMPGSDNNLYGTTPAGGSVGDGTIFRISLGGSNFTSVYSFMNTTDGYTPYAGLFLAHDGTLYGTCYYGGVRASAVPQPPARNYGLVFQVTNLGSNPVTVTPVYAFTDGFIDGYNPFYSKLIQATDGNFYGTTRYDVGPGYPGNGVLFRMTPSGAYTVLHYFGDGDVVNDGTEPRCKLLQARDGFLYGTTFYGGQFNGGIVFKVALDGTGYTILHSFPGSGNGANPWGGLVQGKGSDNNLYGTTYYGGTVSGAASNYGTAYKIGLDGTLTVLHNFAAGTDGAYPIGELIIAADGKLYGVTSQGGSIPAGPSNDGTFFALSTSGDGTYYADYSFNGNGAGTDGSSPQGNLVEYTPGVFYGEATSGGQYNDGTIFKATSAGVLSPLYSFTGSDGYTPVGGLTIGSDGLLYGTNEAGGYNSQGSVFNVTTGGYRSVLYSFGGPDGANPYGGVIQGSNGNFYGTTYNGGSSNDGTLFSLNAYLPFLNSFSPTSFGVGATVTLIGSHLTGTSSIQIGAGTQVTNFTVVSDTEITFVVPSGAATTGKIFIHTPYGQASIGTYTLLSTPAPAITSFTPTSGAAGTLVLINGSHFTGATSVKFNGTSSSYVVNSDTQITASVPSGATSGLISVTTPDGTTYSANPFTVGSASPTVTSFTPTSGPVGTLVQITGTNFASVSSVTFNGTAATSFTVNSDTQITAVVPTGATTGKIAVVTYDGTGTSANNFTVTATAPTITSFSPTSGSPGALVQISGTNLTGATSVKFNGTAARFSVNSSTLITATVPSGATTGKISVTTPGGTVTSSATFTVGPTITSFTPTSGSGGTSVVITGLNFTGATAVEFNGVAAASFTVNSSTQITAVTPSGVSSGRITVTTPAGTTTSSQAFYATPSITSFSPTSGAPGTSVVITGLNFTGATAVKFGGVAATSFTVNSVTQITATVPANAVTGTISVTTPGGTATSSAMFTVTPIVTSFSPTSGAVGAAVTITGLNFTGATSVSFNGVVTTSLFVQNSTTIQVNVPAGATTGLVAVTTPTGTGTSTTNFTVTPAITSFSPVGGAVGTSVTITGTTFNGATSVKFNGTSAPGFTVSADGTTITVSVPTGATTGKITVTTPSGTATSANSFTVS